MSDRHGDRNPPPPRPDMGLVEGDRGTETLGVAIVLLLVMIAVAGVLFLVAVLLW